MSDAFRDFDNRLRRIDRSRVKLSGGYVSVVGRDGLIMIKPRRKRVTLPLRGLFLLLAGGIGLKAMILVGLGAPVYQDRVDDLRDGTVIEQAGAWVMQADPLTVLLAEQINHYRR